MIIFSIWCFVTLFISLTLANPHEKRTPLLNNGHIPCVAESLKETDHYVCDENNDIVCLIGWTDPENECRTPVCEFANSETNETETCSVHGMCERPNLCACEVGWTGLTCDQCIVLPGCQDGTCTNEFECNCRNGSLYTGRLCDQPVCKTGCDHGYCVDPEECICEVGWEGDLCDECITLPGCHKGSCVDPKDNKTSPFECHCEENWIGELCDCPLCKEDCNMTHGYCDSDKFLGKCLCHPGWEGENCDQCIKYPGCPDEGTCDEPWECKCGDDVEESEDPKGVCGTESKFNLLPNYYHHKMSTSCRVLNEEHDWPADSSV